MILPIDHGRKLVNYEVYEAEKRSVDVFSLLFQHNHANRLENLW